MSQILTTSEGCRDAFVHPIGSRRVAIVVEIFNPALYLSVLEIKFFIKSLVAKKL